MNGMNFFSWLRDGVRQSVLLGVSDAIETLGTPAAAEELHPSVAGLLKVEKGMEPAPMLAHAGSHAGNPANRGNRKRLGRSLKDIETESNKG
jgi:hypothetical protein